MRARRASAARRAAGRRQCRSVLAARAGTVRLNERLRKTRPTSCSARPSPQSTGHTASSARSSAARRRRRFAGSPPFSPSCASGMTSFAPSGPRRSQIGSLGCERSARRSEGLHQALTASCWGPSEGKQSHPDAGADCGGVGSRASCARRSAKTEAEAEFREHRKEIEEKSHDSPRRELDAARGFPEGPLEQALPACKQGSADDDGAD